MRSVTLVLAGDKVEGEVELARRDLENGRSAEHAPASAAKCFEGEVQMACRPVCRSRLSSNAFSWLQSYTGLQAATSPSGTQHLLINNVQTTNVLYSGTALPHRRRTGVAMARLCSEDGMRSDAWSDAKVSVTATKSCATRNRLRREQIHISIVDAPFEVYESFRRTGLGPFKWIYHYVRVYLSRPADVNCGKAPVPRKSISLWCYTYVHQWCWAIAKLQVLA